MKSPDTIRAFTTARSEGNARDAQTLRNILDARGIPHSIAVGKQVHDVKVRIVSKLKHPKVYPRVDGFLTSEPGQPLGIFTADCAAIFLAAPSCGVVGLLHAGWRGVQGGILTRAVRMLRRRWRCAPQDIVMWLGPHIGACCFEVQWNVARHFPHARKRIKNRWIVSLEKELRHQAHGLGLRFKASRSAECTQHPARYHSYRRDKTDQRQISVIMRTPEKTNL